MTNKFVKNELKREFNKMLPENMVAEIKQQQVTPKRVVNKNVSFVQEKSKHSILPIIASCVASVILCLAVFIPILIQDKKDYNNYVATKQVQEYDDEYNNE